MGFIRCFDDACGIKTLELMIDGDDDYEDIKAKVNELDFERLLISSGNFSSLGIFYGIAEKVKKLYLSPGVSCALRGIEFFYCLESLVILGDVVVADVDFSCLKNLINLELSVENKKSWSGFYGLFLLKSIRSLRINHWPESDLYLLRELSGLEELTLSQGKLVTLSKVDQLSNLRRLSLSYFPGLIDISELSSSRLLGYLKVECCPKLENYSILPALPGLIDLIIDKSKSDMDFKWLIHDKKLQSVKVGPHVVGVTPRDLIAHPTLRTVFICSRNFSGLKSDDLASLIESDEYIWDKLEVIGKKTAPLILFERRVKEWA